MAQEEEEYSVIELGIGRIDSQTLIPLQPTQHTVSRLSARQMESLEALADTFLPSLSISSTNSNSYHDNKNNNNYYDLARLDASAALFYATSASMSATPKHLAGVISERLRHPKKWMIRVVLWLLSTLFGTFILCGYASLSNRFPYFQTFSQVSQQKREEIVLSWSLSHLYLFRMLFRTVKLLTLLVFFTQVDDNGENPSWAAIGYSGPDPDFKPKSSQLHGNSAEKKDDQSELNGIDHEEIFGPLYRGLVSLRSPRELAADRLRQLGFSVSVIRSKSTSSIPSTLIKCDAVVIGSGSGGGVVAGVLAKAGYKVLVLEKGNYFARANLSLLEGPTMDRMYLSSGLVATDDMGVLILAGSTVGGGSAINWSASIRTPKHVRKEWSDVHGLELFESKLYKEAMDVVCHRMGVQSQVEKEGFNNAVLRRGCEELGYPVTNIPRNSPTDHYCGWCCLGCKDGKKKGTGETWLVDLVESGNGVILPGCEAMELLQSRNWAGQRATSTGVAFQFEGAAKERFVVEAKVTVVACGALSTPPLLRRSGLRNPNIGKNLHLHPVAMAWGYFPESAVDGDRAVWPEEEKKSYQGGIMTAMSTVVADTAGSGYGVVIQTPSLHPGMFSIVMPWSSGLDFKKRMTRFSRTAHVFALARDRGCGTVHESATSISYQMEGTDEENLKQGLEKVLRILAAAGAEEIGTHHSEGRSIRVNEVSFREFDKFVKEESRRALKDLSTPICSAHQMGSCRMGVDPKTSVVNQTGETWEVEGLFIADTSVFPTALGVNPMVTVQAIAYCTAQAILQVLSRKKVDR